MSEKDRTELPPKQLYMVAKAHDIMSLPDVAVPKGYDLRAYQPGDEASWTRTLNLGGFTNWNIEKVLQYLEEPERRRGSHLVAHRGEIVAGTFASRTSNRRIGSPRVSDDHPSQEGVLDYVVSRPDHQGHGLGRATSTGVSKFLMNRGCKIVSLSTDDWRLRAIHIYLSMGFKPVMNREDMPSRWATVLNKLKEVGREYP